MKTNQMLLYCGAMLVVMAGIGLAQDKANQNPQPKLTSTQPAKASGAVTNAAAVSDYPIVGHIEKRGRTITIKAGPKGPLYSVKTTEGKVLFENLSAEQLQAKAPELHKFIKTAVAGNAAKGEAVVDASLGRDARH